MPAFTASSPSTPNDDKDRTKITVAFLLGLTNPNSDNILEFLANEAATRTEGDGIDSSTKTVLPQYPPNMLNDEDFTFLPYGFASGFSLELMDLQSLESPSTNTVPSTTVSPFDPESWKTRAAEIVSDLHGIHNSLKSTDPWYNDSFDLNITRSVFSAENLCMFASTYFRVSHLDFPIVHRPSFGTERTNKLLLLAVGLSGSLRSPPSDDVLAARGFLGLAEEYIFRGLNRLIPPGSAPEFTEEVQETFQAALMIHCVQFFRNDIPSRRKNRTQRLPVLVSAVRCMGLAQTRHAPIFQYNDFVRNEAKIRSTGDMDGVGRLAAERHVQLAADDNACRVDVRPSEPLELWDAKDSTEYFEAAHALGLDGSRRISSVKLCIDALMRETWGGLGSFPFQDINGSDLQLLIFALNGMLLSANLMGVLPASAHSILRAVSRWEAMWESIRARIDPAAFEKLGMVRYNSELCWAARKIIQVAISGDKSSAYMQKVGHDSLVQLHEFVRQYRDS
ncbi:hypothetical protein ColLi_10537 [Colletotrichum liriopes]|uniref:Transcription factor domain-containing protein n=1 Tax=Colletotrichum liriopes TaxID=708192 RepID=A0AA37LWU4_9PEZI|nr:hypothetical protein ColLi_10537 [Colletotrichum liriopes]